MSQDHLLPQLPSTEPGSLRGPVGPSAHDAPAPAPLRSDGRMLRTAARRLSRRGVTLVEVLIVVAIMALISAGVSFFVLPRYREAQRDTATTTARTIRQAAILWRSLKGGAGECTSVSKLIEDKQIDPSSTTQDPWGQPYTITCTEDDVTVSSPGPDGKPGTKDDILVGPSGNQAGSSD
jgi:general secretion pathway protein G